MTYEAKNITFLVMHVKGSCDSWCSGTLQMNVTIEGAHYKCEENHDWVWSNMHGNHKYGQR